MKINLTTNKTGGKHTIKQIAEHIESLGYDVKLTFEYGSLVKSNLNAILIFEKNA